MEIRTLTDTILMIMLLAAFLPIMLINMSPFIQDSYGGFDTLVEKTAPNTPSEIEPIPRDMKFQDVALIFLVADQYQPKPKKVTIMWGLTGSRKEVVFDDAFFNNKQLHVNAIISSSSYLPPSHKVSLDLRSGSTGIRDWRILIQ